MLLCYLRIVAIALSLTSDLARSASIMQLALVYWCYLRLICWEIAHRREREGVGWGSEWRTGHLWCQTELWWMIDILAI